MPLLKKTLSEWKHIKKQYIHFSTDGAITEVQAAHSILPIIGIIEINCTSQGEVRSRAALRHWALGL